MKKKMIKFDIDLSNPPALTAAQKAELKALRAKPESEIDFSGRRQCGTRFTGPRKPQPLCALIPTCCIGCALMAKATSRA
jgi:hypothetical protein